MFIFFISIVNIICLCKIFVGIVVKVVVIFVVYFFCWLIKININLWDVVLFRLVKI